MISILKVADEIIKNAALTHMNSMDQSHIAQGELTFVKTMLFIGHFTVDPFFCLNAIHDGEILLRFKQVLEVLSKNLDSEFVIVSKFRF